MLQFGLIGICFSLLRNIIKKILKHQINPRLMCEFNFQKSFQHIAYYTSETYSSQVARENRIEGI